MSTKERTHLLQLESVTLNFRLWDGPDARVEDSQRWSDIPEYTSGRFFATVDVYGPGQVWIRTLNEKSTPQPVIQRALSPDELARISRDIHDAAERVLAAHILDGYPNQERDEEDED